VHQKIFSGLAISGSEAKINCKKVQTRCVMKHKCPRTRQIPEVTIIGQNPRSRFQNLRLQYKGQVTCIMKYKSLITYHSKDMAKVKVFKKWVKLQGHKVKN
jgi:hypothetical protein